jgi:hypothetical protein
LTEQFQNIFLNAINSKITFVQKALQMTSKTNTGRVLINPVTIGYRSEIFAEQIIFIMPLWSWYLCCALSYRQKAFFLPMEATVDSHFADVNTTAIIETLGQLLENSFKNTLPNTLMESPFLDFSKASQFIISSSVKMVDTKCCDPFFLFVNEDRQLKFAVRPQIRRLSDSLMLF